MKPFVSANVARPCRDMDDVVNLSLKQMRQIRRVHEINFYRLDSKPRQTFRDMAMDRSDDAVARFREVFGGVRADVPAGTCNKNRFHNLSPKRSPV